MFTNKFYSFVLITILITTPISLCSIDYYTDNGRDIRTHTGAPTGDPVCGYQYVSPTTVGAPPNDVITELHCSEPGNSPCEVSTLYELKMPNYDLEISLSRHKDYYVLEGVTDSIYHENRIVGSNTYYGVIQWVTDSVTNSTIAVSNIIVQ